MNHTRLYQSNLNAIFASDDEFLVYNLATRKLHRLNNTAALIFEMCDGISSPDEISGKLHSAQNLDPTKSRRWINKAVEEQLLIPGNAQQAQVNEHSAVASRFAAEAEKLRDAGLILAAFVCQYQATVQEPEHPAYWTALGELAHILGRRDSARRAYERHLDLCPDNAEVKHILKALSNQQAPDRAPDDCILQLYARFSEFYEENMCGDLDYQAPDRINEQLDHFLGPDAHCKVLELGCGTGLAGRVIRPYAEHLTGIDLSPEMVARCREQDRLYDALQVAEITSFLADAITRRDCYDLVVACDTLIYFGDLGQVLKPLSKLMKPEGWVIFTVEKGDVAPFTLTDSGRYSHTSNHIRSVAADAGFEVTSLEAGFLRYEYGEAVTGWVATLRNKPVAKGDFSASESTGKALQM